MKMLKKFHAPVVVAAILGGVLSTHSAMAGTVVYGNNTTSNTVPFGGVGTGNPQIYQGDYQQIYLGSSIGGLTTITGIAFASTTIGGGVAQNMTFDLDISLSNTSVTPAVPGTSMQTDRGTNYTTVFSGTKSVSLLANGTFDLPFTFTTPFNFDSSKGPNLLMDLYLRSSTATDAGGITESFLSGTTTAGAANNTGRIYYQDATMGATSTQANRGLYTQFTASAPAVVPEPSPAIVMLIGGLGLLAASKRRRVLRGE